MNCNQSILVVDDDARFLEILATMLGFKFPGTQIYVSCDAVRGLKVCKDHSPDIVITDISLASSDGLQMAAEIKTIKADTKLIALTAHREQKYQDQFSRLGCSNYILKPFDFEDLFAAVVKCFDEIKQKRQ